MSNDETMIIATQAAEIQGLRNALAQAESEIRTVRSVLGATSKELTEVVAQNVVTLARQNGGIIEKLARDEGDIAYLLRVQNVKLTAELAELNRDMHLAVSFDVPSHGVEGLRRAYLAGVAVGDGSGPALEWDDIARIASDENRNGFMSWALDIAERDAIESAPVLASAEVVALLVRAAKERVHARFRRQWDKSEATEASATGAGT